MQGTGVWVWWRVYWCALTGRQWRVRRPTAQSPDTTASTSRARRPPLTPLVSSQCYMYEVYTCMHCFWKFIAPSPIPAASIFAWTRGLSHRAKLDSELSITLLCVWMDVGMGNKHTTIPLTIVCSRWAGCTLRVNNFRILSAMNTILVPFSSRSSASNHI